MMEMIGSLLFSFLFSLIFIKLIIIKASHLSLIDMPNERSEHIEITPRGAGVGFFIATLLSVAIFYSSLVFSYPLSFIAIVLVFMIGVLDDTQEMSPNAKFIVIILSSVLIFLEGIAIDKTGICCGVPLEMGWLAFPITVFAVVGFTNALNLIDGLDGLAGSISVVILSSLFYIGFIHNDVFIMILSSVFIASLFGFLFYNWNPASIFMGDSGSLTLGFVIALLSIKALEYIPAISVLFIATVPILDTLVAMSRRKFGGKSMFEADKLHFHHLLQRRFAQKTKKSVFILVTIQLLFTLFGLQLDMQIEQIYFLILFITIVIFTYKIVMREIAKSFL